MSRTRTLPWLLLAGVWLLASACGPGAATPMPQPPAFELDHIVQPALASEHGDDNVEMDGGPGSVPAFATVRVTNLDLPTNAAAADANEVGGFMVSVLVTSGQELRFEWLKGNQRSLPADAFFIRPDPALGMFLLQPSTRFDCLTLSPPHALEFSEAGPATLTVTNDCDDAVTLANPRARIGLPVFSLPTELPTLASGDSTQLSVDFAGTDPANPTLSEDTLLFDVTLGAETIRYPVTLRAR